MAQAIVQSSCTKLRSAIGDEATTMRFNCTGDLDEMLEELEAIHAVIPDDENWWMVKEEEDCKEWLAKVKDAAYGICHMLDELQDTKMTPAAGNKAHKVSICCCNHYLMGNPPKKIEIDDRSQFWESSGSS